MDLGSNIKKYRKILGLTQKELAEKSNISRSYLADIENNRYNPSIETLKTLAIALGISVNDFFADDSNSTKTTPTDKINKTIKENKIETIAAHFKGEEFTDEDLEDIENFIKFILSKKKK